MSQEIENNFEERKKDWDLTGLLDDVIRRYIYQLTNDELNEIEADLAAEGKPSNGSDYELRAENVRALRDQDLSYIDHKYEEQRKQKSRPTQHPLKRPKKTMSKI